MGDKTQLLSLVLAARFRRPWPIVAGICAATLANHALAGALGSWITSAVSPDALRIAVGIAFIAMGVWALVPDKLDSDAAGHGRLGVFAATCVAFFLAEMGDKTQLATIGLAARYATLMPVVIGTTLGMLIANVPVVLAGDRLAGRLPLKLLRRIAAAFFILLGLLAFLSR